MEGVKIVEPQIKKNEGKSPVPAAVPGTSRPDMATPPHEFPTRSALGGGQDRNPDRPGAYTSGSRSQVQDLPDETVMTGYYAKMLALKQCWGGNTAELKAGIHAILRELAEQDGDYPARVATILMRHWTRYDPGESLCSYDKQMAEHQVAIGVLSRALMASSYMPWDNHYVARLGDFSCGTGTGIVQVLDVLPPGVLNRLQVVLTDVSQSSLEAAKRLMSTKYPRVNARDVRQNLNQPLQIIGRNSLTVGILSQTLALVGDPDLVRRERLVNVHPSEKSQHISAKYRVIEHALDTIAPGGVLVLIDETPMVFSKEAKTFMDIIEETLFEEVFRRIDRGELIAKVLKGLSRLKFLCEASTHIDGKHSMYAMAFSKCAEGPSTSTLSTPSPSPAIIQKKCTMREARARLMADVMKVQPILLDRLQVFENGTGEERERIVHRSCCDGGGSAIYIDKDYYDKLQNRSDPFWVRNGPVNMVVLDNLLHRIGIDRYKAFIWQLHQTGKLKPGTALMHMELFPAPQDGSLEARTKNSHARELVYEAMPGQVFLWSAKVAGIEGMHPDTGLYAYLYAVK